MNSAAILGMGASCPVGYGVRPIQAAMASGLRNFQDSVTLTPDGKPARISRMPDLSESVSRAERIAVLTRCAVADFCDNVMVELPHSLPVFVGVGHDSAEPDLAGIRRALGDGSEGLLNAESATTFAGHPGGRIAFLSAMALAIRSFDEGEGELALIVAADTRCTWEAMDALYRERRLLNSEDDGLIPGEAAVVALAARPTSRLAMQHARFLLCSPAFAEDEFQLLRRSPQASRGLGRAFNSLRGHPTAGTTRPDAVISFDTGELFFTRAFATGYLRSAKLMPEPLRHELIAANLGDTGAASAGMALLRADWMMHRKDRASCSRVLVYGHADNGWCSAAMTIHIQ